MKPEIKLHLAKYRKYLYKPQNLLIVFGDIEEILISQKLYEERHGIASQNTDEQNRLLNACALSAASLSDRESWGWTLTLPTSKDGFFVGIEPEGMICTQKKSADSNMAKAYLQRQKNDGPLMQSHYEPSETCPVKTIQQYFEQVVQTQTRIATRNGFGVLVQALPDANFDSVANLTDDALIDFVIEKRDGKKLTPLVEFLIFYECRCDEKMIYEMIDNFSDDQQKELFENDTNVEVECPRCGRKYQIKKNNSLN